MSEGKLHRYEAPGAVVTWDAMRCIHAAECVHGLPQVFDPAAKPWIRPARRRAGGTGRCGEPLSERCAAHAVRRWHERDDRARRESRRGHARRPQLPARQADAGRGRCHRARGHARRAVPLRRVAAQAVLRQQSPQRRLPRCRDAARRGAGPARRGCRRAVEDRGADERPAALHRPAHAARSRRCAWRSRRRRSCAAAADRTPSRTATARTRRSASPPDGRAPSPRCPPTDSRCWARRSRCNRRGGSPTPRRCTRRCSPSRRTIRPRS